MQYPNKDIAQLCWSNLRGAESGKQAAKAGHRRAELAERARRLQAAREQEQAATRERLLQQQFAAGCDPLRAEQSKRFLHTVVQGRRAQVRSPSFCFGRLRQKQTENMGIKLLHSPQYWSRVLLLWVLGSGHVVTHGAHAGREAADAEGCREQARACLCWSN